MKTTGVNCTFKLRNRGSEATSAFELVPEGCRVRLFSVIWFPENNPSSPGFVLRPVSRNTIKLMNGQSGDVLFRSGYYQGLGVTVQSNLFATPQNYLPIPNNGILFDNGIWAQGTTENAVGTDPGGGVLAVSITYQGGGSSV